MGVSRHKIYRHNRHENYHRGVIAWVYAQLEGGMDAKVKGGDDAAFFMPLFCQMGWVRQAF